MAANLIIKLNGNAKSILDELDKVKKKTKEMEVVLSAVGKASAASFAVLTAAIVVTTRAYANYEVALNGVGKTSNFTKDQLKTFGKEIQNMSKELPIATNQLLAIAQAGGQLGVSGSKNLLKFTNTIAKLGVATDITGEQGAAALTRLINVSGESIKNIDRTASVLVRLGNNYAATEAEILKNTTAVAQATAVYKLSSAQAAALGTSLKSLGIESQIGGTSTGKAFRAIDTAVNKGGKGLVAFQRITGKTGEELKRIFQKDSVKAFQLFLKGVNGVIDDTGTATDILNEFGLSGEQVLKTLPVLAQNYKLVENTLADANDEYENATALNKEAAVAFSTITADLGKLKNSITAAAVALGEQFAPQIRELISGAREAANAIGDIDKNTLGTIATFIKWATGITAVVTGAIAFGLIAIKVSGALFAIATAFGVATGAAGTFWSIAFAPATIAIAAIAAVGVAFLGLRNILNSSTKGPETISEINDKLRELEKTKERTNKNKITRFINSSATKQIDETIKKLEALKKAKIEAAAQNETGNLLLQTNVQENFKVPDIFGDKVKPLDITEELKAAEAAEKAKTEILTVEQKKRLALSRQNNEILRAFRDGVSAEEIEFLNRRNDINRRADENKNETSATLRAQGAANLAVERETLLADQVTFENERSATIERAQAKQLELMIVAKEEGLNLAANYNELELEQLNEKILTKDEIEAATRQKKFETEVDTRNKFLEDELAHGTFVAKMNKALNNQKVKDFKTAAGTLATLSTSSNSTLKKIGQAAAVASITIDTAASATSVFLKLNSAFPFLAPAIGAAGSAAMYAQGAIGIGEVLGAKDGALVGGAGSSRQDTQPFMLARGELVAPAKNFDQVVEGAAAAKGFVNPEDTGETQVGGGGTITVMLEPVGDLAEIIEKKQIEAKVQNRGVE